MKKINKGWIKKGQKLSLEIRKKMSESAKGRIFSKETRLKLSKAHKGMKKPWAKPPHFFGKKSSHWKGNNVSYRGLHHWISIKRGKPHYCEYCKRSDLPHRHYQWANKDHKYRRVLSDWIRLCAKCHTKYDKEMVEYVSERNLLLGNAKAGK